MLATEVVAQAGPGPLGIAVSGGGDSVVLLLLLREALPDRELRVATVDHGLRPDSAREAAWVAELCRSVGLPHTTLRWTRSEAHGNLMAAAREARRDLLSRWIIGEGGRTVFLGHTRDDIVESFLMKSTRGAGAHGLAAMKAVRAIDGVTWLRPLLGQPRSTLRELLETRGQKWIDDPTNDDPRFERARARDAIRQLRSKGIELSGAARSAERLRDTIDVLDQAVADFASDVTSTTRYGELIIAVKPFRCEHRSAVKEQLMRAILRYFAGDDVTVRLHAVLDLLSKIEQGLPMTLGGVVGRPAGNRYVLRRESAKSGVLEAGGIWDNRWHIGGSLNGFTLRALDADGLRECGERPRDLRADVARTFPSIWADGELIATPFLKPSGQFRFRLRHFAPTSGAH